MGNFRMYSGVRKALILIGVAAFLIICIYTYMREPLEAVAKNLVAGNDLPLRGKLRQPAAPKNAVFGMTYINTRDNREYIFDAWIGCLTIVVSTNTTGRRTRRKSQIAKDIFGRVFAGE